MDWNSQGVTLLQYIHDLLLSGPTEPTISRATESLLNFLATRGYKVSREKAQLCSLKVKNLRLVLKNKLGPYAQSNFTKL
jgi:hypothetical protein